MLDHEKAQHVERRILERLANAIDAARWKRSAFATEIGTSEPRLSEMLRGKLNGGRTLGLDRMIHFPADVHVPWMTGLMEAMGYGVGSVLHRLGDGCQQGWLTGLLVAVSNGGHPDKERASAADTARGSQNPERTTRQA